MKLSQILQHAAKNETSVSDGGRNCHIIYCVTDEPAESLMVTYTSLLYISTLMLQHCNVVVEVQVRNDFHSVPLFNFP